MPDDPAYHQATARLALLEQREADAVNDLRAYVNLATPTNAQTVQALKLLCRLMIWRWRIDHYATDSTD